jgi:hypothetical protein
MLTFHCEFTIIGNGQVWSVIDQCSEGGSDFGSVKSLSGRISRCETWLIEDWMCLLVWQWPSSFTNLVFCAGVSALSPDLYLFQPDSSKSWRDAIKQSHIFRRLLVFLKLDMMVLGMISDLLRNREVLLCSCVSFFGKSSCKIMMIEKSHIRSIYAK